MAVEASYSEHTASKEPRGALCSISCQPSAAEFCLPTPTTSREGTYTV